MGVAAFLLYALTASRTIQWQDYGQFVLRIVTDELFNELGLALAHPLHFWMGQAAVALLPAEPPYAVALVSALAGAVTVANVFGVVRTVGGGYGPALAAAGLLLVANTFWRMSTMPECYTVTTALLSAELWCMALYFRGRPGGPETHHGAGRSSAAGWLVLMMGLNGLGLSNHNMALLTLPATGLVLLYAWRRGDVRLGGGVSALAVWVVGAMPYLVLVVAETVRSGDPAGAVRSALFGNTYTDNVLNPSPALRQIGISAAFTLLSFPGIALPLALLGLAVGRRWLAGQGFGGLGWAWGGALGVHLLFVLRYDVVDQHTFLLPTYTVLSLFIGVGAAWVWGRWARRGRVVLTICVAASVLAAPGVYVLAAHVAREQGALGSMARHKPYRDDYRYLFVPWGWGETSARAMSELAVDLAGQDGVVVVEDTMARFAVGYQLEVRGLSGVRLHVAGPEMPVDGWVCREHGEVVLVPASTQSPPPVLPAGYRWQAEGELYVLVADPDVENGMTRVPPITDSTAP